MNCIGKKMNCKFVFTFIWTENKTSIEGYVMNNLIINATNTVFLSILSSKLRSMPFYK